MATRTRLAVPTAPAATAVRVLVLVLVLGSFVGTASGHGVLSVPRPRAFKDSVECFQEIKDYLNNNVGAPTFSCGEDMYGPLNGDNEEMVKDKHGQRRFPVNDWKNHPFKASLVCRVPNGLQADVPLVQLTAGTTLNIKVDLTAHHPGDGSVFISYDADFPTDRTADMKFFKIATIPQLRLLNRLSIPIKLPAWLPPGKAIFKWSWYGTHNAPNVEFFGNCVDVNIVSSSKVVPSAIPSYKLEEGTGSATSFPSYYCEPGDGKPCPWCYDCKAADWHDVGVQGPPCVGGIEGNCCGPINKDTYTPADDYAKQCYKFTGAARDACRKRAGFDVCKDSGSSGPAPWLAGQPPPPPPPPPAPATDATSKPAAATTTKRPAADAAYRAVASGTCASVGMAPIATEADCAQAGAFLRLEGADEARTTSAAGRPEGCYTVVASGSLWFSTNDANAGAGGSQARKQICRKAAPPPPATTTAQKPRTPTATATTTVAASCSVELEATNSEVARLEQVVKVLLAKLQAANACSTRGRRRLV